MDADDDDDAPEDDDTLPEGDSTDNARLGRITRRDALLGALHLDLIATLLRYVDPHSWGSQAEVAVPVWAILSRCVQHSTAFAELIVLGTVATSLARLPPGQDNTAREMRVVLGRWWGHLDCFLMVPTIAPATQDTSFTAATVASFPSSGVTMATASGMNATSWLALVAAIRFVTHACQSSQRVAASLMRDGLLAPLKSVLVILPRYDQLFRDPAGLVGWPRVCRCSDMPLRYGVWVWNGRME